MNCNYRFDRDTLTLNKIEGNIEIKQLGKYYRNKNCLLYTSDAADE